MENDDVERRRLSPVYSALHDGNYSAAIREIERILKKHHSDTAVALWAMSLYRMGKTSEGIELANAVAVTKPTNLDVIDTLGYTYEPAGHSQTMLALYAAAVEAHPGVLHPLHKLFQAQIRARKFSGAAATALKLKAAPQVSEMATLWSIMARWMAVDLGSEAMAQDMNARLVAGLLPKIAFTSSESVYFAVEALTALGAFDIALDIVARDDVAAAFKVDEELQGVQAECAARAGRHALANGMYAHLLGSSAVSNWIYVKGFVDSLLASTAADAGLADAGAADAADAADGPSESPVAALEAAYAAKACTSLADAAVFLAGLEQSVADAGAADAKPTRNVLLMTLELVLGASLAGRRAELGETASDAAVTAALVRYFGVVGGKKVAETDIARYAGLVEDAGGLMSELEGVGMCGHDSAKALCGQYVVDALKLRLGLLDAVAEVPRWLDLYAAGRRLEGVTRERGERLPGDDFLLLVVEAVQGRAAWAGHTAVILKSGLDASPDNFELRVRLAKQLLAAGAGAPAAELHTELELKSMQLDTMSHLVFPRLARLGLDEVAATKLFAILQFHHTTEAGSGKQMVKAFDKEAASRAPEFLAFYKKLEASHTLAMAETELALLQIGTELVNKERLVAAFTDLSYDDSDGYYAGLTANHDLGGVTRFDAIARVVGDCAQDEAADPGVAEAAALRDASVPVLRAQRAFLGLVRAATFAFLKSRKTLRASEVMVAPMPSSGKGKGKGKKGKGKKGKKGKAGKSVPLSKVANAALMLPFEGDEPLEVGGVEDVATALDAYVAAVAAANVDEAVAEHTRGLSPVYAAMGEATLAVAAATAEPTDETVGAAAAAVAAVQTCIESAWAGRLAGAVANAPKMWPLTDGAAVWDVMHYQTGLAVTMLVGWRDAVGKKTLGAQGGVWGPMATALASLRDAVAEVVASVATVLEAWETADPLAPSDILDASVDIVLDDELFDVSSAVALYQRGAQELVTALAGEVETRSAGVRVVITPSS